MTINHTPSSSLVSDEPSVPRLREKPVNSRERGGANLGIKDIMPAS